MKVLIEVVELILEMGVINTTREEINTATNHLYETAESEEKKEAIKKFAAENKINLRLQ